MNEQSLELYHAQKQSRVEADTNGQENEDRLRRNLEGDCQNDIERSLKQKQHNRRSQHADEQAIRFAHANNLWQ